MRSNASRSSNGDKSSHHRHHQSHGSKKHIVNDSNQSTFNPFSSQKNKNPHNYSSEELDEGEISKKKNAPDWLGRSKKYSDSTATSVESDNTFTNNQSTNHIKHSAEKSRKSSAAKVNI